MLSKKRELNYLCYQHKFIEALQKYPDEKNHILHMLILHGNIETLKELYDEHFKLDENTVLSWSTISPILSNVDKISFIIRQEIVAEEDLYKIIKFNYKYLICAKWAKLNPCQIIVDSKIGFGYIVEILLSNGYTYEDIVTSRYLEGSLSWYLIYSENINSSEVIDFMNKLYKEDKNLLIEFLRFDDKTTIYHYELENDSKNELYKKIIRYIEGRKLVKDVLEKDVYFNLFQNTMRGI